jgi:plastocyanin
VVHKAWSVVVASLFLALVAVGFAAVEGAAASSCAVTVTISGPTAGKLVVTPSPAKVQVGDCVAFHNATTTLLTLKVTTAAGKTVYPNVALDRGQTTSSKASFAPTAAGSDTFAAATKGLLGLLPTRGSGTITVSPATSPTASPTPSGKHSSAPSVHPDVAPSPKKSKGSKKKHTPTPKPTGIKLPPLPPLPTTGVTALPLGSNPVVAPLLPTRGSSSPSESPSPVAAIIGGPLEPVENNRRGLPEAVAVLVVLGLATGWGRVLLALPRSVDDKHRPDHRI